MDPEHSHAHVCVFAKPARPGVAKTRLAGSVGAERAAALAGAFFQDTWTAMRALPGVHPIAAVSEMDDAFETLCSPEHIWLQGDGDLGQRIERVMQRALRSLPLAIAIGADTPGLPLRLIAEARDALRDFDAVLGPTEDGGFYLLGLRSCPSTLLHGLPWSQPHTFDETQQRLSERGLRCAVLSPWFDIDRPQDLAKLAALLDAGQLLAPHTKRLLNSRGR